MITRFQNAGMYPSTVAPVFSQHGGAVPNGFNLTVTAPSGTIYYTTDGTDPREPADPVEVDPPVTVVAGGSAKSAYVPTTASDGFNDGANDWNEQGYDDSGWESGTNGVGYEDGSGYQSYIGIDVLDDMNDLRTSCLVRIPFTPAAADLAGKSGMTLGMRFDDGYVAYLNGTEIARANFTGTPDGNSNASGQNNDGVAVTFVAVDVSAHIGLLQAGVENILAIHGMNANTGSSDFLIDAELKVSATPVGGGNGGAIAPTAIEYTGQFPIDSTTQVRARVRTAGGDWSALNEAIFFQDPGVIVVSEIMYNPTAPTPAEIAAGFGDGDEFEFLEILNTGSAPFDLTGFGFTEGITFDYTGATITTLAPGARALIVENIAAFEFRYGIGHPIAGQYSGKLSDGGEAITFSDGSGAPVRTFTYDDAAPWPTTPDGDGTSLVLINPTSVPDHGLPTSWAASDIAGGTPGTTEVPTQSYATWAAAFGAGAEDDDDDGDGLSNFLEFSLGSSPIVQSPEALPVATIEPDYLTLTVTHNLAAGSVSLESQVSNDLEIWWGATLHRVVYHSDGTATTTFRSPVSLPTDYRRFIRARFVEP